MRTRPPYYAATSQLLVAAALALVAAPRSLATGPADLERLADETPDEIVAACDGDEMWDDKRAVQTAPAAATAPEPAPEPGPRTFWDTRPRPRDKGALGVRTPATGARSPRRSRGLASSARRRQGHARKGR